MTNIIAPFGLQDLEKREGSSPTYGLTKVAISSTDATPIFAGDLVQPLGSAPASGNFGEYITQASSGVTEALWYSGVFRGCEYLNNAVGRVVWSETWPGGANAGADAIAYVNRDPDMQYIIQASTAAIVGSSEIGQNFGVTATASAGNTITGQSGIALASSGGASTATLPLRLKDFYSNYAPPGGFVNGTDNTTPGQVLVVQLNNIGDNTTTGSSI